MRLSLFKTKIELSVIRLSTKDQTDTYIGLDEIKLEYYGELITTPPDPSVDPNQALFCDFDQDSCGIKYGTGSAASLSIQESLDVNGYKFTDISSIRMLHSFFLLFMHIP